MQVPVVVSTLNTLQDNLSRNVTPILAGLSAPVEVVTRMTDLQQAIRAILARIAAAGNTTPPPTPENGTSIRQKMAEINRRINLPHSTARDDLINAIMLRNLIEQLGKVDPTLRTRAGLTLNTIDQVKNTIILKQQNAIDTYTQSLIVRLRDIYIDNPTYNPVTETQ